VTVNVVVPTNARGISLRIGTPWVHVP